jgi:hypothetical protein
MICEFVRAATNESRRRPATETRHSWATPQPERGLEDEGFIGGTQPARTRGEPCSVSFPSHNFVAVALEVATALPGW